MPAARGAEECEPERRLCGQKRGGVKGQSGKEGKNPGPEKSDKLKIGNMAVKLVKLSGGGWKSVQ